MVEIRIYIEGGGEGNQTRAKLREGFSAFFSPIVALIRGNANYTWHGPIACGGRGGAFRDFCIALRKYPDALNILLVDAEDELPSKVTRPTHRNWEHLKARDGWDFPAGMDDSRCFLMIRCMETWLIADKAALAAFYGQNFNANALPKTADLESVPKTTIAEGLKRATEKTKQGEYYKTKHAFDILRGVDVSFVRAAAPECERLFDSIEKRVALTVAT